MARLISRARPLALTVLVAAATVVPNSGSRATDLGLADVPLFLATDVQPNLIMAIDDSTSMDSEVLLHTNDGAAWWRIDAAGTCGTGTDSGIDSFVGCGASDAGDVPAPNTLNFNYTGAAGPLASSPASLPPVWKKFVYLFPNNARADNKNTDRRRSADGTHDHYAIPPLPQYAWARSPVYNSLYFNPAVHYAPWVKADGSSYLDSPVDAARFDPIFPTFPEGADPYAPTMDIRKDFAGTDSADTGDSCFGSSWEVQPNFYFRVYEGMTIPAGTCLRRPNDPYEWVALNSDCSVGTGAVCDSDGIEGASSHSRDAPIDNNSSLAIRYFPATFYLRPTDALPADFGWLTTASTRAGQAPDGTPLTGYEIKLGNFIDDAHYKAARQNFANWFTYYRKRHQALRAGLGQAFKDIHKMRVAGFTINDVTADGSGVPSAPNVTMKDIDGIDTSVTPNQTYRSQLYSLFYDDWVGTGGTPNRPAVGNIIRNLKRSGGSAPIQYACQKNFGMLFTDGFSNPAATFGTGLAANIDGGQGVPYTDNASGTMADGVMGAYLNNLRPPPAFPAGKVPVPRDCNGPNPDPRLDCNRNLHMNFYAITLDSRGVAFDPDAPVDPYTVSPPITWPFSFPARHPSAVDDLWHATINGRGLMLNARGAGDIAEKLSEVLRNIIERTSSASAAAVNSGIISSDTRVYQARFNTATWSGELLSFAIDPLNGHVDQDNPDWDASEELPDFGARKIFTVDTVSGANVAKPFRTAELSNLRKQQVTGAPVGTVPADTLVDAYVNYLRGQDVAGFRERPSKLGDIVSSAPLYVGAPRGRISDKLEDAGFGNGAETAYSIFAQTHKNRTPMIYVGANDGMLHAINARAKAQGGGKEEWAFIPGAVYGDLPKLAAPNYTHHYYVDGAPNVGDAFFGGAWHTVLVGGLNKGGKSIYALDVTYPQQASESGAASTFLWEFTHDDLGYTYSQPAVVRLHNGKWAAVFGNGYNSSTGTAVLFVVDIATGAIIRKFDTQVGGINANGMATPVLVDTDGDRIVDHTYVGDLRGNLWKVDLQAKNAGDWDFAFKDSAGKPLPLFTATIDGTTPQPITTRPEVARGPYGAGVIVLFGTGKYLETGDNQPSASEPQQSFYGLIDANTHTASDRIAGRNKLVAQTISTVSFDPDGATGPALGFPVRTITDNTIAANKTGWYMDLPTNGERQITNPVVRSDRVIFTTLIPTAAACSYGGTSWLMEVDLLNGGSLPSAPLDTNGDNVVDEHDLLDGGGVPIGLMEQQYLSAPAIVEPPGDGLARKIMSGSGGDLVGKGEAAAHGSRGRQSWRQIR